MHERNLAKIDGVIRASSDELRFFHFSGYKPSRPWVLSSHVMENPRVVISSSSTLMELTQNYGRLATDYGWEINSSLEYGYSHLNEKLKLTPRIRKRYRQEVIDAIKGNGQFPPLPSEPHESLLAWLNRQIPESGRLNVALFDVWSGQPDLQATFPLALGKDAERLVWWAHKFGISEGKINESTIKVFPRPMDTKSQLAKRKLTKQLGVNVAGYFNGEFGVGQFGRLVAKAAIASGLPVTTLVNRNTESRQDEEFEFSESEALHAVTIGSINADQFARWLEDLPNGLKDHSRFIGVWAWEIETFPKNLVLAFDSVDEVWAISSFVRDSLKTQTKKPVYVFPGPIIAPNITEKLDRDLIGLNDDDVYNLFIFDYFSVFRRKNPLDLIAAHTIAFPEETGPKLVIKTMNGDSHRSQQDQLRYAASKRSDIIILDSYISRNQLHSLLNECQIYISLHRSEGYGLTLAEAMALGKPVIATGYSGNMDFMNSDNSILVPYNLVPVGDDAFPYAEDARWAQPDIEFAANAIRELSLDSERRTQLGVLALNYVTSQFTMERAAEFTRIRVEYHHKKHPIQKLIKLLKKSSNFMRRL